MDLLRLRIKMRGLGKMRNDNGKAKNEIEDIFLEMKNRDLGKVWVDGKKIMWKDQLYKICAEVVRNEEDRQRVGMAAGGGQGVVEKVPDGGRKEL